MMPNRAASTSAKSINEKKDEERLCCACCISSSPGWAIAPNASRQQQNAMNDLIFLKADGTCIDNGFLFGLPEKVVNDHTP